MRATTPQRNGHHRRKVNGRREFLLNAGTLAACLVPLSAPGSEMMSAAGKQPTARNKGQRLLTRLDHVGMVVKSVEASVRRYWDDLGVGPWKLYTLNASNMSDMTVHGQPVQHSFRAALADIRDVQLELIEPLDDRSVYAEYLATHGEGLHHIAFDVEDFKTVAKMLKSKGYKNVQSARIFGNDTYVYFNLNRGLACTAELNSNQTAPLPTPESTYP